jgi:hypothetical protein
MRFSLSISEVVKILQSPAIYKFKTHYTWHSVILKFQTFSIHAFNPFPKLLLGKHFY